MSKSEAFFKMLLQKKFFFAMRSGLFKMKLFELPDVE